MQPEVEILSGLERRVDLVVSMADVEKEVQAQLKRVARTAKVQGFRPGKAPLSLIERSHGPGIRYDVINAEVGKSLDKVIGDANLRVAGTPSLEPKTEGVEEGVMAFSATFEVYPEVQVPDLSALQVKRAKVNVGDAEVQRTLDILRKQRATYEAREGRAAQDDDRVTLDFVGTIDGEAFDGGSAEKFPFVLGQGRMLPEFETAVRGMKAGESKTFPLTFPEQYGSKAVAGKTAEFKITVTEVAEPMLPAVDAEFAKSLGQAEGDVDKLLADIRANIEREAKARAQARSKGSVMDALAAACTFDVPKALVESDAQSPCRRRARRPQAARRAECRFGAHSGRSFQRRIRAPRAPGPAGVRIGEKRRPAGQARTGTGAHRRIRAKLRTARPSGGLLPCRPPAACRNRSHCPGRQRRRARHVQGAGH